MKFKAIVFDLDGTISKSDDTIVETTNYTLKKMNLYIPYDEDVLRGMIGHHFKEIFEVLNIPIPDMEEFINEFKSNYFSFLDKTELYPGAFELLEKISGSDLMLGLLTTKGQDQAEKILHHFSIYEFFDIIVGRVPGLPIKPSPEPLFKIADSLGLKASEMLLVGDTEMDVMCAKNAGAVSCAVTFGYRKEKDLSSLKPDYLTNNYEKINKLVFG